MGSPSRNLSNFEYAVAGGGSGFLTRALCQPFDVLKIRFQLQVEPISNVEVAKYKSIPQAIRVIFREETAKAFWKGHVPAQWLSITYGMVQFSTFEFLTKTAYSKFNNQYSFLINFTCGSIAGCASTLVSFPFDIVRTRLIAQSKQKIVYRGVVHSLKHIVINEGPFALYRGLFPTFLQIAPYAGIQFMNYKILSKLYAFMFQQEGVTVTNGLVSGSLAGLSAKVLTYPLDLLKKRLQIQGFESGREGRTFKCNGMVDAVGHILRGEGFSGFFKGLSPTLLKSGFASALYFGTYEMCCDIIQYYKTL